MKFHTILVLMAACFLACSLCACSNADRSVEVRNPFRFNSRAPRVAGPDYMQVPTTYAPTFMPAPAAPAPAACYGPRLAPPAAAPAYPGCP